ncbi:Relaxase/Mobilisation nuclease domain-containing protein [Lachnospiraceae bacterium NK3A20]|nr:Relaxase/Mobilisation nuclease domain-containing protein [Lachnospiraceae bacterium NK3A20]
MAATRLIAMHQNKGRSIARCLKDRTDYAKNDEKTENGALVTAYACDKETVDQEFLLAKQEYLRITGRKPKGDILAYQIRQSFLPGEITPEEANKVGYETALRFTKGSHAFIVATHTDRAHIHNHIIFNAVNLSCDRKFRDSWFIALALQKVSDVVCLEHALSVIEPRKPGERDNHNPYLRDSFRNRLREAIDLALANDPKDFQDLLIALEQQRYEIKRGKHPAVRGDDQKRFIRFRSLGEGYTEEDIRKRIAGEWEIAETERRQNTRRRKGKRVAQASRPFDLLVDINRKMAEGKGKGYEHWAKIYNAKQVSKALLFLQEHGIRDYGDLEKKTADSTGQFHALSDAIKEREQRLTEIAELKNAIIRYVKTNDVYQNYRKSGYSKKFLEAHREEITVHKAAKMTFDKQRISKLPKVRELSEEYGAILAEKRKLYEQYKAAKKGMMDYQIAKQDIDHFLKVDEAQHSREQKEKRTQSR